MNAFQSFVEKDELDDVDEVPFETVVDFEEEKEVTVSILFGAVLETASLEDDAGDTDFGDELGDELVVGRGVCSLASGTDVGHFLFGAVLETASLEDDAGDTDFGDELGES
eukprot:gene2942-biopygen4545